MYRMYPESTLTSSSDLFEILLSIQVIMHLNYHFSVHIKEYLIYET